MLFIQVVGYALLVPFFGWGIFLLRRRYLYHEESAMSLEIGTTAFVGAFFWVEMLILREALSGQLILMLAAALGLSIAGFALYAHVLISLASRVLVELVSPGWESPEDRPRFGPVEALEREENFEDALSEYLVLARIYSRNIEVLSRTARTYSILGQPEEAEAMYLRARKRAKRADDALETVNHLCRLYDNELEAPEKADYQLARFIRDFPDSPDVDIVRDRLNRRADKTDWSVSDFLEALEDDPLSDPTPASGLEELPAVGPALNAPAKPVELVSLESEGAAEGSASDVQEPATPATAPARKKVNPGVAPLEEAADSGKKARQSKRKASSNGSARAKEPPAKAKKRLKNRLEALDDVPANQKESKPKEASPGAKSARIGLDPMDNSGG